MRGAESLLFRALVSSWTYLFDMSSMSLLRRSLLAFVCIVIAVVINFPLTQIPESTMSKPTVAIAGATGRLGIYIVKAVLSPEFKPNFKEVIVLTRQKSDKTAQWEKEGATLRTYDESNVKESLEGVDVLVNA